MTNEEDIKALDRRVAVLETRDAVRLEKDAHMDKRFDRLEQMQRDTQGTLNRLAWMVVSAVVVAALAALLNNGGVFGVG